jgi:hypothetical protein
MRVRRRPSRSPDRFVVATIIGEGAAPDKGKTARRGFGYFFSIGFSRSSSSSDDIEPSSFTPFRKKVGVETTFSC